MTYTVHEGDALAVLRTLPSNHYHGSLSDPPYGLSFMGHTWDHGVPSAEVWAEVLRCLKPGAHLLAFGGTRTFHRLTCAIEDAGFEIRDCMQWIYGSGFPKSHDVSKAIDREAGAKREVVGVRKKLQSFGSEVNDVYGGGPDKGGEQAITAPATEAARQWAGHGTALKPAWEPIILARKPLEGTVAQNVQAHGCGGLAIDASRVGSGGDKGSWPITDRSKSSVAMGDKGPTLTDNTLGRWPANVILDEEAGQVLDAQSGNRPGMSGGGKHKPGSTGGMFGAIDCEHTARGDSGGASRFFYCPKASRSERDAGLEDFDAGQSLYSRGTGLKANGDGSERSETRNIHPTVKPLALNRYLARLLLPPIPDARMLTPFCGSGSEMIGAMQAGWAHVDGIDSWDVAARIARARLDHWSKK